jgi:hypothetical protein
MSGLKRVRRVCKSGSMKPSATISSVGVRIRESLSLLTCCSTDWNAEKFVKKLFGEKEIEAVLERLDRLTQDEARTTAAQTLEVVYGLVQNMRMVMDRE